MSKTNSINQSLDINKLYSWVWFKHWARFVDRWKGSLLKQGYIDKDFADSLSTLTQENVDGIEAAVVYMRNKIQFLFRDKSKTDPQVLILKAAARRPYSYTTLDVLKGRTNLQNLLERISETDDDDFGNELQTFESSQETYDFKIKNRLIA